VKSQSYQKVTKKLSNNCESYQKVMKIIQRQFRVSKEITKKLRWASRNTCFWYLIIQNGRIASQWCRFGENPTMNFCCFSSRCQSYQKVIKKLPTSYQKVRKLANGRFLIVLELPKNYKSCQTVMKKLPKL